MNNRNVAVGILEGGSSFHCFHWNLECFVMWRDENRRTGKKNPPQQRQEPTSIQPTCQI